MKPSEIRSKADKELIKILGEKRAELLVLQLKRVTGQLAKTAELRKTKRDIARMITIMRQKTKEAALNPAKKTRGKNATK